MSRNSNGGVGESGIFQSNFSLSIPATLPVGLFHHQKSGDSQYRADSFFIGVLCLGRTRMDQPAAFYRLF